MAKRTMGVVVVGLAVLAAGAGFGQSGSTPPVEPERPTAERTIEELEKSAPGRETIKPTTAPRIESVLPGAPSVTETRGRLLREGTFLTSRRGRMVRSSTGEWVYTFDSDAQGQSDPPMILMPCLNLMAMERLAERGGDALTFSVSGQVFVYHGKNYLLPSLYVINRGNESGQK